jgi:lipoate-protein ligase A
MAIDVDLLAAAARSGAGFLRLYRFDPACLSFGRHEPAHQRYDREAITRLGVDVVRRPTGGRAVWHEHELTYAVAAPIGTWGSLRDTYHAIHARLIVALRALGAPATLGAARGAVPSIGAGACFATPVDGEVLVAGRKLVGSAQWRQGGAFLQHGSILLGGTQELVARVTRAPALRSRETTLSTVLGRRVSFEEVAGALLAAFGCVAPARAVPAGAGPPSPPFPFSDTAWTWRR